MATTCKGKSNNYKNIPLTDFREFIFDMVHGHLEGKKISLLRTSFQVF